VVFGDRDAFIVNQAGMFHRVDPGTDCILDGLGAMSVGSDPATEFVGLLHDRA